MRSARPVRSVGRQASTPPTARRFWFSHFNPACCAARQALQTAPSWYLPASSPRERSIRTFSSFLVGVRDCGGLSIEAWKLDHEQHGVLAAPAKDVDALVRRQAECRARCILLAGV